MKTIKQLEQELNGLKRKQGLCSHKWDEPVKTTINKRETYQTGRKNVRGIHIEYETAYRDVQVGIWKRVCPLCGAEEYTTKETPTAYNPVF